MSLFFGCAERHRGVGTRLTHDRAARAGGLARNPGRRARETVVVGIPRDFLAMVGLSSIHRQPSSADFALRLGSCNNAKARSRELGLYAHLVRSEDGLGRGLFARILAPRLAAGAARHFFVINLARSGQKFHDQLIEQVARLTPADVRKLVASELSPEMEVDAVFGPRQAVEAALDTARRYDLAVPKN